jgi:hypothetical protein
MALAWGDPCAAGYTEAVALPVIWFLEFWLDPIDVRLLTDSFGGRRGSGRVVASERNVVERHRATCIADDQPKLVAIARGQSDVLDTSWHLYSCKWASGVDIPETQRIVNADPRGD